MEDYLEVLRKEFEGDDGAFLLQIRINLEWNKKSFSRLVTAREARCEHDSDKEMIGRLIANGFWYVSTTVRSWTTQPNFPRVHCEDYYERCYDRLDELAFWYFEGVSANMNKYGPI